MIGAGAAGITAATALGAAGVSVTILEARDRIGGRMFTVLDPVYQHPVELGAEFIHGRPPEIWDLLKSAKIPVQEVGGDNWCVEDGRLGPCDFFSDVDTILEKLDDDTPDESFLDFLKKYSASVKKTARQQRAERWATNYIVGFNAADPSLVGTHWLIEGMRADRKIEGDRSFRAPHGYSDLIEIFRRQLKVDRVNVRLNTVVQGVRWKQAQVEVIASGPNGTMNIVAPQVLITVPLGVMQAPPEERGAIQFTPELPADTQSALENIMMGKIIRVTLSFRERFWERLPVSRDSSGKTMKNMSFLFSHDDWFPTWWSTTPEKIPFLIGWAPFRCAERLSGRGESFIIDQSMSTLSRLLGVSKNELECLLDHAYLHDWQSDPFARGAYSYGKAGFAEAQRVLSKPIDGALFFAGEATDVTGHNGTVHGAIASGLRASEEILRELQRRITRP